MTIAKRMSAAKRKTIVIVTRIPIVLVADVRLFTSRVVISTSNIALYITGASSVAATLAQKARWIRLVPNFT